MVIIISVVLACVAVAVGVLLAAVERPDDDLGDPPVSAGRSTSLRP